MKRSREYATLAARELLRLPLPRLLEPEGGLVAMWVTNRERIHRCIEKVGGGSVQVHTSAQGTLMLDGVLTLALHCT